MRDGEEAYRLWLLQQQYKREHKRVISSWDRVKDNLDPVLAKLKAFGLDATAIINAWANATGVSTDQIIADLAHAGIAADDLKLIFAYFRKK